MRYSRKIVEALFLLLKGETVYSGRLGNLADTLCRRDHFEISSIRGRIYYTVKDLKSFKIDLAKIDESFCDVERLLQMYDSDVLSRGDMASYNGNSKICAKRTFNGFLINSYQPICATLLNRQYIVNPTEGTFTFVYDWRSFSVPDDVIIIGIENCENYERIRAQKILFEDVIEKVIGNRTSPILFVSRYPLENSSSDLRHWLLGIPNRYIHYGDFDLKGIDIFHTEYYKYLGNRSTFFIPENIEFYIKKGSRQRWDSQYECRNITSPISEVQSLIDMINKHKRCYDQEGFEKEYLRWRLLKNTRMER